MIKTSNQFDSVVNRCKDTFMLKNADYGTSWRMLRPSSITDQIFIKAQRIKGIELSGTHKVNEGIEPEFMGIINYAIIALIQMNLQEPAPFELSKELVETSYNTQVAEIKALMEAKNHDYGEVWRNMRTSSFTDMILMRIRRIKQIEDNLGQTIGSEGVDANYMDIANYAIFALIQLEEKNNQRA